MSRPYDGTPDWWLAEIEAVAPIVHQNHTKEGGTWRDCPMASCTRFRAIIEAAQLDTRERRGRWLIRTVADMVKMSPRVTGAQMMPVLDVMRAVCFHDYRSGEMTGHDCP